MRRILLCFVCALNMLFSYVIMNLVYHRSGGCGIGFCFQIGGKMWKCLVTDTVSQLL